MKKHPLSAAAMLAALAAGLFAAAEADAQASKRLRALRAQRAEPAQPAGTTAHKIKVAGTERNYLLLDAGGGKPAPLLIVLHGGGGNAGSMVGRWEAKARQAGLVVAFPNGSGRNERMGTWNAVGCCGFAMTDDSKDVAFITALIDEVQRTHRIDPRRIYVAGMSNGGMMTHRIAIALGDRLAGAGIVAGAMFGGETQPRGPVPIMIIHGVKDSVVPYAGGPSTLDFVAKAQSKPFEPVRYAVDFWVHANGCTATPATRTAGDATIESFTGCKAGADVTVYSLASANHTWPGATGESPMLERYRYDQLNATDVLWDFFSKHVRK
ncbi:PHB depolymerase family esterase [Sphingomonas sp. AOB5]|uniref:extracellular catalytic domain type 1 short-chain-length polyhydroxyalkanoate depolymerase n=1 Tax=Sphingomonas sp. AOB5 TaxID=3034017 RepID=UPI0023F90E36|nr:PHB depolymerase family esterase [Sphingomonas sp. AOB5]MDF7774797.1 PHB depolymerase family esterase [Sphingomonas sp. AOB5]